MAAAQSKRGESQKVHRTNTRPYYESATRRKTSVGAGFGTLLDFSSKTLQRDRATRAPGQGLAAIMKRSFMDDFLAMCYPFYDIVVWSQTSWRMGIREKHGVKVSNR
jgi:hypothetical protein